MPWLSLASDCEYAVKVPQLLARSATNHVLTKVVRAEFEARAKEHLTELWHVRGHSGDPGNELADVVADLGCSGELSHSDLLTWLGALRLPEVLERPKLQLHSLIFWAEVLAAEDPGLRAPGPLGTSQEEAVAAEQPPVGDGAAPRLVRMATANVLTLRPGQERDGVEGSARGILLEEQFAEAGIHFVGVQEARSPQPGIRKGRRYTRVIAAADAGGAGGVELWINPKLRIDPETIFVLDSSPKLLVVSLVWQSQQTLCGRARA